MHIIFIIISAALLVLMLIYVMWVRWSEKRACNAAYMIMENSSDAIFLINYEGKVLRCCNAADNRISYHLKAMMEQDRDVFHWMDAASRKSLGQEIKQMKSERGTQVLPRKLKITFMGNNREDNVTLCATSSGRFYMVVHVSSINPKELSALKDRLFMMENLLDNLPIPTSVKDLQKRGEYILWNRQSETLFDTPQEEVLGKGIDILQNEVAQLFSDTDRITMQDGHYSGIKQFVGKDGSRNYVLFNKRLLTSDDSQRWIISSAIDVTQSEMQRKLLEEKEGELLKAIDEADRSNKLKSEFLANMSHEIRTPLNAIVGFSDIVADADSPEERKEVADLIRKNANDLVSAIDGIMELSRIQTGEVEVKKESLSLSSLIRQVMNGGNVPTELVMKMDLPDVDYYIDTDREILRTILDKLLSNALKYTSAGGVCMGYAMRMHEVHIFVADTGCGISAERIKHLFDRFEKSGSMSQGVGVGLAISKALVTLLGGTIGVRSEKGQGSVFWIDLPCTPKTRDSVSNTLGRFIQKAIN